MAQPKLKASRIPVDHGGVATYNSSYASGENSVIKKTYRGFLSVRTLSSLRLSAAHMYLEPLARRCLGLSACPRPKTRRESGDYADHHRDGRDACAKRMNMSVMGGYVCM